MKTVDVDALIRLQERIDELARIQEPPRYLADDVTPEAIALLLCRNRGTLGILSPEGDFFQMLGGRYNVQGRTNFALVLKAHSGDPHQVDRAAPGARSLFLPRPLLSIGIATQPAVVSGLCATPEFQEQGLLARFLYAVPTDLLGRRDPNPPPVPERLTNMYAARLRRILGWTRPETPAVLHLSQEARTCLEGFLAALEPELAEQGHLGDMRAWGAKLAGQVLRIAGLLHLAALASTEAEPWNIPVDAGTLERAIRLAEQHLIPHARAAFCLMGRNQVNEDAMFLLKWITGKKTFTKREAFIHGRARFKKVENLEPVLELLAARNYIRPQNQTGKEGRPSAVYEVHPSFVNIVTFVPRYIKQDLSLSKDTQKPIAGPFSGTTSPVSDETCSYSLPPPQKSQNTQNPPRSLADWSDSEHRQLEGLL